MNPAPAAITTSKPLRTRTIVMADTAATLPTKIELIKSGIWPASSVKGPLTITPSDLQEMVTNFNNGVGCPTELGKLPIDFSHEDWGPAAGWITALELGHDDDDEDPTTVTLYATVEWSKSGAEALQGGEYKCVSPSFWPACLGEWYDPEDSEVTARNVLVGAGLTNIPFFKDLEPLMASRSSASSDEKSKNVIYINADERKPMTVDEIRVLDADKLSEEQKQFLTDHKSELSAEELTKFGIDADNTADDADKDGDNANTNTNNTGAEMTEEVKAAVSLQADIKSGKKVVMDANEVETMKGMIQAHSTQLAEYRKADIKASVETHLKRGAIKADQVDKWVERIEADATVGDLLKDLPDNKVLASEIGNDNAADVASAAQQFDQKVTEAVKASEGKLSYSQAVVQVAQQNPQLAADRQKQLTNK